RRTEDSERDVQHPGIGHDLRRRYEAAHRRRPVGSRVRDLEAEYHHHRYDQRDDERFDEPESLVLQCEHYQHIQRGQRDSPHERQMEQQVERDRRPQHFGNVTCYDAELGGERLQKDRNEVRNENYRQQRVVVNASRRDVGGPVAGIHVPDGNEIARAREGERAPPHELPSRHMDGPIHFGETRYDAESLPSVLSYAGVFGLYFRLRGCGGHGCASSLNAGSTKTSRAACGVMRTSLAPIRSMSGPSNGSCRTNSNAVPGMTPSDLKWRSSSASSSLTRCTTRRSGSRCTASERLEVRAMAPARVGIGSP